MRSYPRVLIIIKTQINEIDSVGASLRNWFKDWPKTNLFQIYSGCVDSNYNFCNSSYKLSGNDRYFCRIFSFLKGSSLGSYSRQVQEGKKLDLSQNKPSTLRRLFLTISEYLAKSGVWELIFGFKMSSQLRSWINEVNPDVMFIQPTDIGFMRLAIDLHKEFKIPICLHVADDWPNHLYKRFPFGFLLRPIVEREFRELSAISYIKLGTSEKMKAEFINRYKQCFEPLMICDERARFDSARPIHVSTDDKISIVYSGSIDLNRWISLVEISRAASLLTSHGINSVISAFVPFIPQEAVDVLAGLSNLKIYPALRNEQVPGVLKGADILFLPESFNSEYRSYIALSISTKSHIYMMSGRPTLVYGPPEVGVVDYARSSGWGYVVEHQDIKALSEAINKIVSDEALRESILSCSQRTAATNHEASVVRAKLLHFLTKAIHSN